MFEKNMRLAFLLDFYGDILDTHARSIMKSYYEDDLSLAEIAEGIGISRQGVRHIIKKSEDQLDFFETKLGLAERFSQIEELCGELRRIAEEISAKDIPELLPYSSEILSAVDKIIDKSL